MGALPTDADDHDAVDLDAVEQRAPRLHDHDLSSLASLLHARAGGGPPPRAERARRVAARALKHAFGPDGVNWNAAALAGAGVGRWAQPSLLTMSPRIDLELAEQARSSDGTSRLLLRARDGALIESVIIPAEAGRDMSRTTLCISSQVGCARACTFCETGVGGLSRQLLAGEIVDQYRIALALCLGIERPQDRRVAENAPRAVATRGRKARAAEQPVSNIVFMGMGEPFDNLSEVLRAIALLSEQTVFDFAPSRITVSTVGVADKLAAFFGSTRAELAISVNAASDDKRTRIMPINRRFDLSSLRAALVEALPAGRRVLFQYALFDGFNDSDEDADALAAWVAPVACRVNVIPANPGPDPALVSPPAARVDAFVARLASHGVTTLVRRPRGRDVGGACGQLAGARRLVQLGAAPEAQARGEPPP